MKYWDWELLQGFLILVFIPLYACLIWGVILFSFPALILSIFYGAVFGIKLVLGGIGFLWLLVEFYLWSYNAS